MNIYEIRLRLLEEAGVETPIETEINQANFDTLFGDSAQEYCFFVVKNSSNGEKIYFGSFAQHGTFEHKIKKTINENILFTLLRGQIHLSDEIKINRIQFYDDENTPVLKDAKYTEIIDDKIKKLLLIVLNAISTNVMKDSVEIFINGRLRYTYDPQSHTFVFIENVAQREFRKRSI